MNVSGDTTHVNHTETFETECLSTPIANKNINVFKKPLLEPLNQTQRKSRQIKNLSQTPKLNKNGFNYFDQRSFIDL